MKKMKYKVLIADDEEEIRNLLKLYLENEGYTVVEAKDGAEAVVLLQQEKPDLCILDIMMPNLDGYQVLRKLREESNIPVMIISAKDTDSEKILGLNLGADDYISKPFNPMEVVARIKAQLRRNYDYHEAASTKVYSAFGIELDADAKSVKRDGEAVLLTGTEYKILELLMSNAGRIYTKQQIFEYAWEGEYIADDSTIMVHISNLRNKLKRADDDTVIIKTVKGLGYKFEKEN